MALVLSQITSLCASLIATLLNSILGANIPVIGVCNIYLSRFFPSQYWV